MNEGELPFLEEKKRYVEKLDFESLVFRQIDRINESSMREGSTDAFIVSTDRLASLSLAYGDNKLNVELDAINEDFNEKKGNVNNVNLLKVNTAEKKFDAVMKFLARSGLSGRKKQTTRK